LAKGKSDDTLTPCEQWELAMFKEFRAFIARGNVLDLAVAVIIGAAFSKIVTSLTDDVLMPVIGKIFGGLDFSSYFLRMGPVPVSYTGSLSDYAALKKAGVPLLGYGAFVTQAVNFVIVAFIIFLLVRTVNRATALFEKEKAAVAEEPKVEPADVGLLREIRDELRARRP
jgi:large conductance mechanosensitive channel